MIKTLEVLVAVSVAADTWLWQEDKELLDDLITALAVLNEEGYVKPLLRLK